MVIKESRFKRRAQRVKIPALLEVGGKVYKVSDISVLGLRVEDSIPNISPGAELLGTLILPLPDSSINLRVELIVRHIGPSWIGFEFKDLGPKKRRVIRHYIELAIEGRLGDLESLVSSLYLPEVETPVLEAISLAEEEKAGLYQRFRRHMWFWLVFGLLVILAFVIYVTYNTLFVFRTAGLVIGTPYQIASPARGVLARILVREGERVLPGRVLFEINSSELETQKRKLEQRLASLKRQLKEFPQREKLLKELLRRQEEELKRAKVLFNQGIISLKDYQFVEGNYLRLKMRWLESQKSIEKTKLLEEIEETRILLDELDRRREDLRVKAPVAGVVEEIMVWEGAQVQPHTPIMTLLYGKPRIAAKIPVWEALKFDPSSPVKVYDPSRDRLFLAQVERIEQKKIESPGKPFPHLIVYLIPESPEVVLSYGQVVKIWFPNRIYSRVKDALEKIWP